MERPERGGRERILTSIRSALREIAPRHASPADVGPVFGPIGDPLERFQSECQLNHTECLLALSVQASAQALTQLLGSLPPGEIFVQETPSLRRMAAEWPPGRRIRWSSQGGPTEATQATVTHAEMLVAQTGSVWVSARCGGRGASIVAPVHIVVADIGQLVADLEAAFAQLQQTEAHAKNSMLCLITGSSRTADIEKTIVMGAHGPRRLVVIVSTEPVQDTRE